MFLIVCSRATQAATDLWYFSTAGQTSILKVMGNLMIAIGFDFLA
jgi:hypothetical protein